MNKIFLIIALTAALYAQPCLPEKYQGLIKTIDKFYSKQKSNYQGSPELQFKYEIIPYDFFPFLCVKADTLNKLPKGEKTYLCGFSYEILVKPDKVSEHVQIAVVSYPTWKRALPINKTYRLFFFYCDPMTREWLEERKALTVILELTDKEKGWFGCK